MRSVPAPQRVPMAVGAPPGFNTFQSSWGFGVCAVPFGTPAGHVGSRHGAGNGVALGHFAAQFQQGLAVFHGFHAFGHHFAIEGPSQFHHGCDDAPVIRR